PPAFIQPKKQPKRDIWYDSEPVANQNPEATPQPEPLPQTPPEITDPFEANDSNKPKENGEANNEAANNEANHKTIQKVAQPPLRPAVRPEASPKRLTPKPRKKSSSATPSSPAYRISTQTTFSEPLQKQTLPKTEYASSSGRVTQNQVPPFGSAPPLQLKPSDSTLDAPPD
ncbi:MAG: hypothetical protein VKK59_02950, partial [Vampirovibrionales bacterium]|nr:hypothetical protein [Vampirovibrionales bacterium]